MKYKVIAFSIFILGFLCYTLFIFDLNLNLNVENSSSNLKYSTIDYSKFQTFDLGLDFINIFINNFIVAIVLSLLGFLSGGILTTAILFWNGFLFATIFILGYYGLSIETLLYLIKHAPLELYALFLFSEFGFKGFSFYKEILLEKKIDLTLIPKIKPLLKPTIILFLAAIIEVL